MAGLISLPAAETASFELSLAPAAVTLRIPGTPSIALRTLALRNLPAQII
jgi:hypothetical protein